MGSIRVEKKCMGISEMGFKKGIRRDEAGYGGLLTRLRLSDGDR